MAYNRINWTDDTPIDTDNLNHIEQGIYDAHEKLESISEGATNVVESTINGNIIIDGVETTVYTLPAADDTTLGGVINSADADNMITIDENGVIKAIAPDADMIALDTSSFNKNLDSSVSDVQKLAEYVNSGMNLTSMLRKLRNGGI